MYASKKAKITCCSELRKWSPKTPFSGGVSCWHLPYQKSMCPQRTLKCTLKMNITCCSELWKWSPKTPLSGGVSCWHLPDGKSAQTIQKLWKNCGRFSNKKTTRNKKNKKNTFYKTYFLCFGAPPPRRRWRPIRSCQPTRDFWRFRAWLVPFFPRPWSVGARHGSVFRFFVPWLLPIVSRPSSAGARLFETFGVVLNFLCLTFALHLGFFADFCADLLCEMLTFEFKNVPRKVWVEL